jgi:hypothetical protein
MLPKRKRILLEKHNRLEPIDENKLKSKTKRSESDIAPINDDLGGILHPDLVPSKTKRPFEIPALDHNLTRAKLPAKLPGIMNQFDQPPKFSTGTLSAKS